MAMCTSGNLSICATAGTCRSISTAVGGGSGSLSSLSVSAGKSAPHGMIEFYGYSSASLCVNPNYISFTQIPSNCNICICATVGLSWSIVKSDSWIFTIDAGSGSGSDTVTFGTLKYTGTRAGTICITSTQPTACIDVTQGVV